MSMEFVFPGAVDSGRGDSRAARIAAAAVGAVDIHPGDNIEVTPRFASASFGLIYVAPPSTRASRSRASGCEPSATRTATARVSSVLNLKFAA